MPITFDSKLLQIHTWTILRVPKAESLKLSSRGLVMVKGTMNEIPFQTTLEPDGKGSHWFKLDDTLLASLKGTDSDSLHVTMEQTDEWIEPKLPIDIKEAIEGNAPAHALWTQISPGARWDWIRWIRSTKNPVTRKHRIDVALSKMNAGMKRPCCFNRNLCTEPEVSHNWVLLDE